jgi:hypothetical protein
MRFQARPEQPSPFSTKGFLFFILLMGVCVSGSGFRPTITPSKRAPPPHTYLPELNLLSSAEVSSNNQFIIKKRHGDTQLPSMFLYKYPSGVDTLEKNEIK